jgi:hypothetical protein
MQFSACRNPPSFQTAQKKERKKERKKKKKKIDDLLYNVQCCKQQSCLLDVYSENEQNLSCFHLLRGQNKAVVA